MAIAVFIEQAPSVEIRNEVAHITAESNGKPLRWHMPIAAFRESLDGANRALAEHDAARKVVRFPR